MPQFELTSPLYLGLLFAYFVTSSITVFDIRMSQAKMGMFGEEMAKAIQSGPQVPSWIALVFWLDWIICITLFILNWKITIIVWIVRFILKWLSLLESVGNVLMRPFRPKRPDDVSDEHMLAAYAIVQLSKVPYGSEDMDGVYQIAADRLCQIPSGANSLQALKDAIGFLQGDEHAQDIAERQFNVFHRPDSA